MNPCGLWNPHRFPQSTPRRRNPSPAARAGKRGQPHAEEYTWNDYIAGMRVRLVGNARYAVQRAEAMREVTRARAAGFDIPDAVLRLV